MPHGVKHTEETLLAMVDWIPFHSCWEWGGEIGDAGYGRVKYAMKKRRAHRIMYENFRGPIPDGLVLDHLCNNKSCVNPAHLEPVTQRVNLARARSRRESGARYYA